MTSKVRRGSVGVSILEKPCDCLCRVLQARSEAPMDGDKVDMS